MTSQARQLDQKQEKPEPDELSVKVQALVQGEAGSSAHITEYPRQGNEETTPPIEPEESPVRIALAYLACILIWGTTWFAVRLCVAPGGFEPFTALSMRFVVAMALLGVLFGTRMVKLTLPDKRAILWTALCAIFSVLSFILVYNAERSVSGALAAIISTTTPLLTALMVTMVGLERVTLNTIIGVLFSFAGIVIIFQERLCISVDQGLGIVMLFCSVILASLSNVVFKKHAGQQSPFASILIFSVVSLVAFTTLSAVFEGGGIFTTQLPLVPTLATIYLGTLGSVVAFSCWFYLMSRISLMALTSIVFFPPIIALTVDSFFEKEVVLSGMTYLGICVTLAGVCFRLPRKGAAKK